MNKILYLQTLANKYGDFKVAIATKQPDGEITWSKHRYVLDCWQNAEWFLELANNREILQHEIVLDIDKSPTLARFNQVCNTVEHYINSSVGQQAYYRAYFSGSTGYHIHIFCPALYEKELADRKLLRLTLIREFPDCDVQKRSESVMIALEGVPHYKTGDMKKMLRCYPGWLAMRDLGEE